MFCQKLGYDSGQRIKKKEKYSVRSFNIGACRSTDTLETCSGGCNDYQVGRTKCHDGGNAKCDDGWISITIECSGGAGIKSSSCDGKILWHLQKVNYQIKRRI